MKKWYVLGLALLLLSPLAADARRQPSASPSPTASPTPAAQPTDKRSLSMTATLLGSFETHNSDGDPSRDVIVVVESLSNANAGSVALSFKNFIIKDPKTGVSYAAVSTSSEDFKDETTVSSVDGVLPDFKLYFDIPGTVRPNKIYVRVGDTLESYPLGY